MGYPYYRVILSCLWYRRTSILYYIRRYRETNTTIRRYYSRPDEARKLEHGFCPTSPTRVPFHHPSGSNMFNRFAPATSVFPRPDSPPLLLLLAFSHANLLPLVSLRKPTYPGTDCSFAAPFHPFRASSLPLFAAPWHWARGGRDKKGEEKRADRFFAAWNRCNDKGGAWIAHAEIERAPSIQTNFDDNAARAFALYSKRDNFIVFFQYEPVSGFEISIR